MTVTSASSTGATCWACCASAATLGMRGDSAHRARNDFRSLWGTVELPFFSRYDALMCFRLTPLGAHCLHVKTDYQPASIHIEVKPVLRVPPNLEIAASGPNLESGE